MSEQNKGTLPTKPQKTPNEEIQLARKRLKELLNEQT
jgi:phage-related protein